MEYRCRVASPLGEITLRSDGEALTGLRFDEAGPPEVSSEPEPPVFEQARRWLARFFAGLDPGPTPPLRPAGSDFQRAVWALLTEIPRGQTRSYGALAAALAGRGKASARAVGGAVRKNPLALLIPCHRVIGADGSLVGFAWGLERKAALLRLEGLDPERLGKRREN